METLSYRLYSVWAQFRHLQKCSAASGNIPPSCAPCSPAPGRTFLIVRDDAATVSSGMFLSFDSILSQPSRSQATAYERYSLSRQFSDNSRYQIFGAPHETNQSPKLGKKRWASLRSLMPFTGLTGGRSRSPPRVSDIRLTSTEARTEILSPDQPLKVNSGDQSSRKQSKSKDSVESTEHNSEPTVRPYQSHSFRFSLEWTEKPSGPTKSSSDSDTSLRPKLPATARTFLESIGTSNTEDDPDEDEQPTKGVLIDRARVSKYAGMALAEWKLVIHDCQDFFERRRAEGIPTDALVETPCLKVDSCRKFN